MIIQSRPSPVLDPRRRIKLANNAKWAFSIGILVLLLYFPAALHANLVHLPQNDTTTASSGTGHPLGESQFEIVAALVSAILASAVATGISNLVSRSKESSKPEPVERLRDWLVAGLASGIVYIVSIFILRSQAVIGLVYHVWRYSIPYRAETWNDWLHVRLFPLMLAALAGALVARLVAVRAEDILPASRREQVVQLTLQAILVGFAFAGAQVLIRPITTQGSSRFLITVATLLIGGALFVLIWAWIADRRLWEFADSRLEAREDGSALMNLTITIIGGRSTGKTTFLAGAYREWTANQEAIGPFRIVPAKAAKGEDALLDLVARRLYDIKPREWPTGNQTCTHLPFDLYIAGGAHPIARYRLLDYPGESLLCQADEQREREYKQQVTEFQQHVRRTDAIILIADASYARRDLPDPEFNNLLEAYKRVIRTVVDANGRNRVIPVALVMTKCDEFIDHDSDQPNRELIAEKLNKLGYLELEKFLSEYNRNYGAGFTVFSSWFTSAVTNSYPFLGTAGFDYSQPFRVPDNEAIWPSGCAAPLLWIAAKSMYWNTPLARNLSSFIVGSRPFERSRIEASLALEAVAVNDNALDRITSGAGIWATAPLKAV